MRCKQIVLLILLIFSFGATIFSQPNFNSEWEIIAGRAYGRFHQFSERFIVKSNGEINYFSKSDNKESRTKNGKINTEEINQIGEMLRLVNLPAAKKIPDDKYNSCIMSPHLPGVYFTLKQNGKNYSLTHCNGFSAKKPYDYTIILNDSKKKTYENLRRKITSLFRENPEQNSLLN